MDFITFECPREHVHRLAIATRSAELWSGVHLYNNSSLEDVKRGLKPLSLLLQELDAQFEGSILYKIDFTKVFEFVSRGNERITQDKGLQSYKNR
jgi:hypothetical protein